MISTICRKINNWFVEKRYFGTYSIENGELQNSPTVISGQYYRIIGSTFNDGVHLRGSEELTDEPGFCGSVWTMRIPNDFLKLVKQIEKWNEENSTESGTLPAYTSESFEGYSYTRATGKNGGAITWAEQFASDLNEWRKV